MSEHTQSLTIPEFEPALPGFRAEEFLALTESLLAFPVEHDQAALNAAPFRLERPEPRPEAPLPVLPPRWYPRPAEAVIAAAQESLTPPPRTPVFEGRAQELAHVLRPLLAGHPVRVEGEAGVGKTALLAHVAGHERTRQRFRRIWWIDQPDRLDQTLALALNLPHALAEPDPVRRRAWLAEHLDDHTLLIVDNLVPDHPLIDALPEWTEHVLLAVDTLPEPPDPEQALPGEVAGVVTLRGLDEDAASDALAAYAGLEDTRRLREQLARIATALGLHPYALMLAGMLVRRDGLTLDELEDLLALDAHAGAEAAGEVPAGAGGEVAAQTAPDDADADGTVESIFDNASVNRALDISVAALPRDYRRLFEAFAAFPTSGAPFDGLRDISRLRDELAARRGLIMLAQYGFIRRDHNDPQRYIMYPVAYAHASNVRPSDAEKLAKAMRAWAGRYARSYAGDPLALHHAEPSLRAARAQAGELGPQTVVEALDDTLTPYLREYVPGEIDTSAAASDDLGPERSEAATLTRRGIEATDAGSYDVAERALRRALDLRLAHDSPHAIAESEVALARLYDATGRRKDALDLLVQAAERVYTLGAKSSLSVVRRGLARVYRHLGQLAEALGVLDEATEAHYERALILRAQMNYSAAVEEMAKAEHGTPYDRAEILLLAGRYADALDVIKDSTEPEAAHLRAQAYHLQGHIDQAVRSYREALEQVEARDSDDPAVQLAWAKTLRGLGAALASAALAGAGDFTEAQETLEAALRLYEAAPEPDPARVGGVMRLLAALQLAQGDPEAAGYTAREALAQLERAGDPSQLADAYRTLGRALWQQRYINGALEAFQGEAEQAQAIPERDEVRIGVALHHVADAHRAAGEIDRAIANYRRAVTHKKAGADPQSYLMTQLALHTALVEAERFPHALEVAQDIVDRLARQPDVDLQQYGVALARLARTQHAIERPIRAQQSLMEWARVLAARGSEALDDPRPGLRLLALGLAVRSLLADERPALALPLAEHAQALALEHVADTPAAWAAIRDLGETYMALDRPEEAIITLEVLLNAELSDEPEQASSVAHAYALTGQAYRMIGDPENALAHLRLALEYEPDQHLKSLLHEQIAAIQLDTGAPEEAVETLQALLPLVDRDAHVDVAARALTTLAHTLGGLNRYAEAITVYEDALAALRDVPDVSPAHTAEVLRSLGRTHEAQGQQPDAARAYRRALNILERHEDAAPRLQRDILLQLARVSAKMGDQTAVSLYEQVRDLTQQWGDEGELGTVLCELADVHRDASRYPLAIQHYQAALQVQPVPPFLRERLHTLRSLGRAYAQMERYDEARDVWTEALDLSGELPDQSPQETGLTHHAIAEAYRSQGHYDEAERSYQEALRHLPAGTAARAETLRALGQTLLAMGRSDDAIEHLRKALEAEKAQPQQVNARLVQTLQLLAQAHEEAGDLDAAVTRYHEVLVYMDRDLQPVAYADTLRTLGALYRDAGRYADAHKALDQALAIETDYVPRSDKRISATLQAIADTYRAAGDLEQAAEYYQKVTVYASMARRASEDLRATLDELDRRRATLQAAQQSLALLDRSDNASIKDMAFIYALIAHSHASLNQPQQSADTIHTLLDVLEAHQADLSTDDPDADKRALAWLVAASHAERQDDIATAEFACGAALEDVQNRNVRWVIEQVARSLDVNETP